MRRKLFHRWIESLHTTTTTGNIHCEAAKSLFLGPRGHLVYHLCPPRKPVGGWARAKNLDELYSYINHHRTTTNLSDIVWSGGVWWCLEHWCCDCADAAEAAEALMLLVLLVLLMELMRWCTDAADALMLLNQDQDLLADLSKAICSSYFMIGHSGSGLFQSSYLLPVLGFRID